MGLKICFPFLNVISCCFKMVVYYVPNERSVYDLESNRFKSNTYYDVCRTVVWKLKCMVSF